MNPLVVVCPLKETILLDHVTAFGYRHEFFKPEKVEIKRMTQNNDTFYKMTFKPLGIEYVADSSLECLEDLSLQLYWLWDEYVVDSCPSPDRETIGIRTSLKSLIKQRTKAEK